MHPTRKSERGASAVEYALLVSLIAGLIVLAVGILGTTTAGLFARPCEELAAAGQECT